MKINEIVRREELSPTVKLFKVKAPLISRKYRAGQFVILRIHECGERIPLTVADADGGVGTITLIFQEVGKTTTELGLMEEGDEILDLVGPLGNPSDIRNFGRVVCIGGGIGIAPIHPIAKALKEAGNKGTSILGARCGELLILRDEMAEISEEMYLTTDDGSCGGRGFVTDQLRELIDKGEEIDRVFAVGPLVMMSAVCELTRPYKIKTIVSLNPIMVDGTGMCGSCRVSVNGKTKFACVDGPEFDGHLVDFTELFHRTSYYLEKEKTSFERFEERSKCQKK